MRILVTGYSGQLGYDVVQEGLKRGVIMIGVTSEDFDISNKDAVNDYVKKVKPDAIIHCAAFTAVDRAEDEQDVCWNVNVGGTKNLVFVAKEINAKFMYISTDYVFDGIGGNAFVETDSPNPLGYYGLTKYEGEKIIRDYLTNWFIIRTSWVFGLNGGNFVRTMLKLSENQNELNVVNDQIGSPTYTFDLARLLMDMVQSNKYGIYHATNEGYCSWAEFAVEIFRLANREVKVNCISTEEFPTRVIRPRNSRLSKQKLIDNGFKPLPKWQDALKHYLAAATQEVK